MDGKSNIYGNVLFGWRKGFFHDRDEGHEGFFGSEGVVVILNQLEKLPLSESQRFLDVLEQWEYRRHGEETREAATVKVKIIFTTNVPVRLCDNLSADLKNRLLTRRATIPPLSALTLDEQKRDLRLYVTYWCRDNGVILAPGIFDRLHEIDLSKGSYRTLRGVLEVSRFLALSAFDLADKAADRSCIIHVAEEFFEEAMRRNEVTYTRATRESGEGVPRQLACLVAIWISYECVSKNTYQELAAKQGRSSTTFNEKLSAFRSCFASTDDAWNFFLGSDSTPEILGSGALDEYLDEIGASPAAGVVSDLFEKGPDRQWVLERARRLAAILFDDMELLVRQTTKKRFQKAMR